MFVLLHSSGILLLTGMQVDMSEAKAFLHENNKIDISSNSWGPSDDGNVVDGPGFIATKSLKQGAQEVRVIELAPACIFLVHNISVYSCIFNSFIVIHILW